MAKTVSLTPMLRQYLAIKAQHPEAILMYRMGDFYEMFYEDARRAAPLLEVALTARNKGSQHEAPMCGVPHHAVEGYIGKLLRAGLRVAVCEQVEDPATAKGLVRREVTRVVTPGTVSDPGLLEGRVSTLLAAVAWADGEGGGAFLEVSTGRFTVRRWSSQTQAADDLRRLAPREILYAATEAPEAVVSWIEQSAVSSLPLPPERWLDRRRAFDLLAGHFGTATLRGFGMRDDEPAVVAAAAALQYAQETQRNELRHVSSLSLEEPSDHLILDATTLANLEVFRPARTGGGRGATLLSVLDRAVTPPGARLLRDWLGRPLRDPVAISRRQDAVQELLEEGGLRGEVRERLGSVGDPERLASRAVLGTLTPREAAALRQALSETPGMLAALRSVRAPLLAELAATDPVVDLASELQRVLDPSPAPTLREGGVIAAGVDAELDEARSLARDSKRHVLALERREREATGISSLKIRYNRVFGYFLEVTRANQALVPAHYSRRQTLANAERYVTAELQELEERILTAEERQLALEATHFDRLRQRIADEHERIALLSRALSTLDVLAAFAEVASANRYCRPQVDAAGTGIEIRAGRHPVVERLGSEPFVPNDTELDGARAEIVVLTGPNMGGKSTYLRQVALLVVLAQAGSFVPADAARIGVVDRVFTRVGASDDLARGESTFMVEMIETANILHAATAQSLVVLDEVGRGTATFDGLSLAWAIVEHLHEHCRPLTLFATHYHELTELAALLPRVVNRTMAVKEWEDRIVFLRRVVSGSADKSYGLHVARLAGIPPEVVQRAGEILHNLEAQEYDLAGRPRLARGEGETRPGRGQMSLFTPAEDVVAGVLRELDVERLTPLAALNLLHSLKSRLDAG